MWNRQVIAIMEKLYHLSMENLLSDSRHEYEIIFIVFQAI